MLGIPALALYSIHRMQPSAEELQKQRDKETYEAFERHKARKEQNG